MTDKEILICLIIGFVNSLKLIDHLPDDDKTLDMGLSRITAAIEVLASKVFNEKFNMDFGTIGLINASPYAFIEYIKNYES